MRSLPKFAAVAAALLGSSWTGHAHAQVEQDACQPRDGLSTCLASDNLWPHAGGGRWLSQAPTDTTADGSAAFGFVPTFLYRPIGLRVASPDPEGTIIYAVETVLAASFLAGIGVGDRVELDIAAPVVLHQTGASKSDVVGSDEALPRSAVGDLRFGARLALIQRDAGQDGPALAARFEMAAPTGQDNAFVGYSTATWAPGVSFDQRIGSLSLGVDAGARLRGAVELGGAAIGSQISTSLGVGYDILDDGWLSVGAEAFALFTLNEQRIQVAVPGQSQPSEEPGDPHIPAEWLLSVRSAGLVDGRFRVSLGGGGLIPTGSDSAVTAPAFRAVMALHYVYGADEPADADEDPARTGAAAR